MLLLRKARNYSLTKNVPRKLGSSCLLSLQLGWTKFWSKLFLIIASIHETPGASCLIASLSSEPSQNYQFHFISLQREDMGVSILLLRSNVVLERNIKFCRGLLISFNATRSLSETLCAITSSQWGKKICLLELAFLSLAFLSLFVSSYHDEGSI